MSAALTASIVSFDGTVIAVRRGGMEGGLPVLICNALGAGRSLWDKAAVDLERERTIVYWDHRGLFESSPPASDRIDPGAHAEDGIAAVDHFDIDRFALVAWSSGARIAVEIAHRYPERTAGLVLVCGSAGQSLRRLLGRREILGALPIAAGVLKHFSGPLHLALAAVAARPELTGFIRQSGIVGSTADTAVLVRLFRELAHQDLRRLLTLYEALMGSDAGPLLPSIEAPTLLIAGERDLFTPVGSVREIERAIPSARLAIYERATHYLPIEFPAKLSDDLRKFLAEIDE